MLASQEMHEAYLERVGQWVKAAPGHEWGKDYAKENYSRAYMCVSCVSATTTLQ